MARSIAHYELSEKKLSGEDELIGVFRSKEITRMIGRSIKTVSEYAYVGTRYKGRWSFERVEMADWAAEWDRIRLEILERGKVKA